MPKGLWAVGVRVGVAVGVGVSSLLAAACSKDDRLAPLLPPCTARGDSIRLGVVAYAAVDPGPISGCMVFPDNPTASAIEYLLVPQAVNGVPDDASGFLLRGAAVAAAAPPALAAFVGSPRFSAQQQFDLALRRSERELVARLGPPVRPQLAPPLTAAATINPGDLRTFKVCGNVQCDTHPTVGARAQTVGFHIAIFVDTIDRLRGDTLTTSGFDTLTAVFDTLLYARDTAAFGRESDIDGNGRVLVLMTGKVNSLVSAAGCPDSGYIAGYFYGGDLGYPVGNNAEIFYSLVPDPAGKLSCPHARSDVTHQVPVTFIHEFQHMISWGHHVLSGHGVPEELWLNEGLSHFAEELGGRIFLPDTTTYCYFLFGDLVNSGQYFGNPAAYALVDTAGLSGFANRGAGWLFVRFLVDQFKATLGAPDSVTRRLDDTTGVGASNVSNAGGGTPFETIVEHWALANYISDTLTAPPELQYATWHFRTDYPALHTACLNRGVTAKVPSAFPLIPTSSDGRAVNLVGTLLGGSGTYHIAQQAAGAPGFTLLFGDRSARVLRASLKPRLNVIRIQ